MNVLLLCLIVGVYSGWVGWCARRLYEERRDAGLEPLREQVDAQRARDVLAAADDVQREAQT